MINGLTEQSFIRMMRDEYKLRLIEIMGEADMFDKSGNMVIRKGLKVRHKDTQYEYTVDDVTKNNDGSLAVSLKLPEEPRFSPETNGNEVITGGSKKEVIQELDPPQGLAVGDSVPVTADDTSSDQSEEEEVFVIDQEEFEKEYEVK
jgi:hypothetical protein